MVSSSRPRTPSAGKSSAAHGTHAQAPTQSDKMATSAAIPEGKDIHHQNNHSKDNHIHNNSNPSKEKEKSSQAPRRSSLGLLLRRTKSNEFGSSRKRSQNLAREQELQRQQAAAIPKSPPRLPDLYNGAAPPQLQSFGGGDRPDSVDIATGNLGQIGRSSMDPSSRSAVYGGVPIPPVPAAFRTNGTSNQFDPYARTESMTHRGRYSYASSAVSTINSPRRVRRRKDPTPFNILIIGASSSGKTSFLNFLKTSLALPAKRRPARPTELADDIFAPPGSAKNGNFEPHYLETEIDGERIGLTIWDSEGLETNVVDLQLREMSSFLESKFEETFTEEMKVVRAPGVQDTHIHCAFLILDPMRIDRNLKAASSAANGVNGKFNPAPRIVGGLDEDLDLQVLRTLQGKTTVVPVISKADTITTAHMTHLKKTVWDSLRTANLDPLEALGLDDFEPDNLDNTNRIDEGDEDEASIDDGASDLPIQSPDPSNTTSSTPSSKRLSRQNGISKRTDPTSSVNESSEIPYLPLSIISPDIYEPGVIGRKFPWGFADPMNAEHCDFVRLKEAVFSEWRGELREASRELWYEGWRTSRLKKREGRGMAMR